jgi:hypothetical protein
MPPVKTQREKAEAARKEKLALMREQVKDGSLVIRQMTAKERDRHQRRSKPRNRAGRRSR